MEVTGSNPIEALNIFQASFPQLLKFVGLQSQDHDCACFFPACEIISFILY